MTAAPGQEHVDQPDVEGGDPQPPPVPAEPIERVSRAIQFRPGIIAAAHRHLSRHGKVDGAEFYVGADELVQMATTSALRQPLVAAVSPGPSVRAGYGGWARP